MSGGALMETLTVSEDSTRAEIERAITALSTDG